VTGEVVELPAAALGVHLDHQHHLVAVDLHRGLGQLDGEPRRRQIHRLDPAEVVVPSHEPLHRPVGIGHPGDQVGRQQLPHHLEVS
jgi:hypothetical protein